MKRALVKATPVELVKATNPVAEQLGRTVEQLPPGVYRMHTTICRVTFDKLGHEQTNQIVSQQCFDFESKPLAQALPAAPPPPDDDQAGEAES